MKDPLMIHGSKMRLIRLLRRKSRWIFASILFFILAVFSGLFTRLLETSYTDFKYPLNLPNLVFIIEKRLNGHVVHEVDPINVYSNRFLIKNEAKCQLGTNPPRSKSGLEEAPNLIVSKDEKRQKLKTRFMSKDEEETDDEETLLLSNDTSGEVVLIYVIKSAIGHKRQRDAIRKTWGNEGRFIDVPMRRIFILGSCVSLTDAEVSMMAKEYKIDTSFGGATCQDLIDSEAQEFGDIVQGDFIDTYYNNTWKTMMALKWLNEYCAGVQFALFVDDDYYVSTKNLLKFLRDPFGLNPKPTKARNFNDIMVDPLGGASIGGGREKLNNMHFQRPDGVGSRGNPIKFDGRLYAGYVFENSRPMRHKIFSKWFISLEEYPYTRYPPYVTAGAFVLSNLAIKQLYIASNYVQHFRFDDIYLGILAKKINLIPLHSEKFHFHKISSSHNEFKSVIASHGYENIDELINAYVDMKNRGCA